MAARGVNVPPGIAVHSLAEVPAAAKAMASAEEGQVVVKSQILAGGRGLGKFTNGFQGGVHVCDAADAPGIAAKMLGGTLVTKQSGPAGKPVNTLLIAKKLKLAREMYLAILLDRKAAGPVLVACPEGGTSIEDLAEEFPDKIRKIAIDPRQGLTDAQASEAVAALEIKGDKEAAKEQIKALYKTFAECDCTMVEVNPLAETADGVVVAADAKLGFDDSASFRQKELFAMRDASQEDPR
jgi:succinyl-CoA synthetase beta subunit